MIDLQPQHHLIGRNPHLAAYASPDDVVVAREHDDVHTVAVERHDGFAGRVLRRIEEPVPEPSRSPRSILEGPSRTAEPHEGMPTNRRK